MKRAFLATLTALLIVSAGIGNAAEKPEFRAMWVSSYGTTADICTPEGIDRMIAHAKLANLNALVVQFRKTGDAFYKSDTEPRAEDLAGQPADFDPMAYTIEKAHANGLEVHAWLNTYKVWVGSTPPKDPNHVFNKHPEWINTTINGRKDKENNYGLDPGIREVTDYVANVYIEAAAKYDLDGVHFDYCRYWDPSFGYSDMAVARFNKETGRTGKPAVDDPVWCQWRRDRVTDLVRQVYEGVQKAKPWVRVTASVVSNHPEGPLPMEFSKSHPYNLLLQDWERWTREGIIDAVFPMNYKRETMPDQQIAFREWTDGMVRWKHDRHAYNGLTVQPPDDYAVQVNESRTRGTDGTCGFAFNARGYYRLTNTPPTQFGQGNSQRTQYQRNARRPRIRSVFDQDIHAQADGGTFDRNSRSSYSRSGRGSFNPAEYARMFGRASARGQLALALRQKAFQTWVPTPPMPWKAARPSGGPDLSKAGQADSAIYAAGVDGALAILRESLRQNPSCAETHYRLGRVLRLKGMKDEAAAEFQAALKADPNHPGALAETK